MSRAPLEVLRPMYPFRTRIKQKILQQFYRGSVSAPFISQGFFKSICDIVLDDFDSVQHFVHNDIDCSKVVYCKSSLLRDFLLEISPTSQKIVIIAGGSDEIFIDEALSFKTPHRLYLQNSHISDDESIFTLPIGLEDLSLALNGLPRYLKKYRPQSKKRVLVGPFSRTHPIRAQILCSIESTENIFVQEKMLTPRQYANLAQEFPAIACPRGNGNDTHRFWETLYRGSIPIVEDSAWARSLKENGIPLIIVDEWTNESLSAILSQVPSDPIESQEISMLWAEYWLKEIRR